MSTETEVVDFEAMVDEVRRHIRVGDFDDYLDRISSAIRVRREKKAARFGESLNIGDRVRIKGIGMGAKYLNGAPATVTGFALKNIHVAIDDTWDTRRYSHNLRIPPGNLELIPE
jgi:hypothetical protein